MTTKGYWTILGGSFALEPIQALLRVEVHTLKVRDLSRIFGRMLLLEGLFRSRNTTLFMV